MEDYKNLLNGYGSSSESNSYSLNQFHHHDSQSSKILFNSSTNINNNNNEINISNTKLNKITSIYLKCPINSDYLSSPVSNSTTAACSTEEIQLSDNHKQMQIEQIDGKDCDYKSREFSNKQSLIPEFPSLTILQNHQSTSVLKYRCKESAQPLFLSKASQKIYFDDGEENSCIYQKGKQLCTTKTQNAQEKYQTEEQDENKRKEMEEEDSDEYNYFTDSDSSSYSMNMNHQQPIYNNKNNNKYLLESPYQQFISQDINLDNISIPNQLQNYDLNKQTQSFMNQITTDYPQQQEQSILFSHQQKQQMNEFNQQQKEQQQQYQAISEQQKSSQFIQQKETYQNSKQKQESPKINNYLEYSTNDTTNESIQQQELQNTQHNHKISILKKEIQKSKKILKEKKKSKYSYKNMSKEEYEEFRIEKAKKREQKKENKEKNEGCIETLERCKLVLVEQQNIAHPKKTYITKTQQLKLLLNQQQQKQLLQQQQQRQEQLFEDNVEQQPQILKRVRMDKKYDIYQFSRNLNKPLVKTVYSKQLFLQFQIKTLNPKAFIEIGVFNYKDNIEFYFINKFKIINKQIDHSKKENKYFESELISDDFIFSNNSRFEFSVKYNCIILKNLDTNVSSSLYCEKYISTYKKINIFIRIFYNDDSIILI